MHPTVWRCDESLFPVFNVRTSLNYRAIVFLTFVARPSLEQSCVFSEGCLLLLTLYDPYTNGQPFGDPFRRDSATVACDSRSKPFPYSSEISTSLLSYSCLEGERLTKITHKTFGHRRSQFIVGASALRGKTCFFFNRAKPWLTP